MEKEIKIYKINYIHETPQKYEKKATFISCFDGKTDTVGFLHREFPTLGALTSKAVCFQPVELLK